MYEGGENEGCTRFHRLKTSQNVGPQLKERGHLVARNEGIKAAMILLQGMTESKIVLSVAEREELERRRG